MSEQIDSPKLILQNLIKRRSFTIIKNINRSIKLSNCYVVALCEENTPSNVFSNKNLIICVFTNDTIYLNYGDPSRIHWENLLEKLNNSHTSIPIMGSNYYCFNYHQSFGHALCVTLSTLYYGRGKGHIPLSGYTTKHMYELIKLHENNINILTETNTIYCIEELFIYQTTEHITPDKVNSIIIDDTYLKAFKNMNLNYIPCFIKFEDTKTQHTLGRFFTRTPKMMEFLHNNNIKLIEPEKLDFVSLINIIYNAPFLIVQWGALTYFPTIFANNNKNNFTNRKMIVMKHKSYVHENLIWMGLNSWDPKCYIITQPLNDILDDHIPYLNTLLPK